MVNRRLLIATAALATVGWGSCEMSNVAAATACGGNATSHLAPIDCSNTNTVSGVTGGIHLTVDTAGNIHVDAQVNKPNLALYLQVKAHVGISSNAGFVGQTAVFAGGLASVSGLQMPGCLSQVDIKIVPGTPTLDHVSDVYRVAAPLVELPDCGVTPTTVPQSSTTSGPPPSSTAPPPTTTLAATTTVEVSTAPTPPSGGGGADSQQLPATGSSVGVFIAAAIALIAAGFSVLNATRRRP